MSIKLEVKSAGLNAGNTFSITLGDNKPIDIKVQAGQLNPNRGWNVVAIDEASLVIVDRGTFDVLTGDTEQEKFAKFIHNLPDGHIVAIAAKDTPTIPFPDSLGQPAVKAAYLLGSTQIDNLIYRGSWALIGRKGLTKGGAIEISNDGKTAATVAANLNTISAQSAGFKSGDFARIIVNKQEISVDSNKTFARGLNVAYFGSSATAEGSKVFDIYWNQKDAASFADYINKIPATKIVAITLRDAANPAILTTSKLVTGALAQIGGSGAGLKPGVGWSIVGVKNEPVGSVLVKESSSTGSANATNSYYFKI